MKKINLKTIIRTVAMIGVIAGIGQLFFGNANDGILMSIVGMVAIILLDDDEREME